MYCAFGTSVENAFCRKPSVKDYCTQEGTESVRSKCNKVILLEFAA